METTLSLTMSCLDYLCQDHHDPSVSADETEEGIMYGFYRLHTYAESMWLSLVEKCLSLNAPSSIPPKLLGSLETFAAHRFVGGGPYELEALSYPINSDFDQLKKQLPNVYRLLVEAAEFRRRCDSLDFRITDGK